MTEIVLEVALSTIPPFNTSAGRLLVPEGIIRPVVIASELTCFITYIYV